MPITTILRQFKAKGVHSRHQTIGVLTSVVLGLLCSFVAFWSSWDDNNHKRLNAESQSPPDKWLPRTKQEALDHHAKAQPATIDTQLTANTSIKTSSRAVALGNNAHMDQLIVHNGDGVIPQCKGLQVVEKQIASPDSNNPFAVEITFQVQAVVCPFAIAVTTDNPTITRFTLGHNFRGIIQSLSKGNTSLPQQPRQPQTHHYLQITSPAVTPTRPLIVTVLCNRPFHVLAISSSE